MRICLESLFSQCKTTETNRQTPITERNNDFRFLRCCCRCFNLKRKQNRARPRVSFAQFSIPNVAGLAVRIGRPVNSGANGKRENKTMNLHKGKLCRILFEATHGTSATTMRIRTAGAIAPNEN